MSFTPASSNTGKIKNLEHGAVQASHIDVIVCMTHAEPLVTLLALRLHNKLQLMLHSTSSSIICILIPTTLAV